VTILEQIAEALEFGEDEDVKLFTVKAVEEELTAEVILEQGLLAGMRVVGKQFREHEIFLPDVLLAARAMKAGVDIIKPLLLKSNVTTKGRILMGTVKGDLHDIGKNLVGIMLRGEGYEVIDIGVDNSAEEFINIAVEKDVQIIGLSALLTTTMPIMKEVVDLLKIKNHDKKIKIIIGGAPVTEEYCLEIGADAYGFDASNAVTIVGELMLA